MNTFDFRLRQLECFVTVATTLNFSKAAKLIFMTQPTLSTQIKSLEEEFGHALFERSRNHVRLTPSGELLLITAKTILREVEELNQQLQAGHGELRLRLAADSVAMISLVPELARQIKRLAPKLKLILSESSPESLHQQLVEGHVDALIGHPTLPHPDIVFHQTAVDTLVAAVPSGHRLADSKAVSIHELARETLLVTAAQDCRRHRNFLQELFRPFKLDPPMTEISLSCTSHLSMVAAGVGISLVPRSLERIQLPFVSFVPFFERLPTLPSGISHRRSSVSISLDILMRASRELSRAMFPAANAEAARDVR